LKISHREHRDKREVRRQRTEDRKQRTEVRRQKAEDRGQETFLIFDCRVAIFLLKKWLLIFSYFFFRRRSPPTANSKNVVGSGIATVKLLMSASTIG